MPWIQTSPGRFERDFDSLERFYHQVIGSTLPIGREHFQISVTINVTPFPSESELRNGWKMVRNRHPQIAASIEEGRFVYKTPTASQLEQWSMETCFYHRSGKTKQKETISSDNLHNSNSPITQINVNDIPDGHKGRVADVTVSARPLDHIELHAFPSTDEIQLRASHWRVDGIGSMHLTDALLTALASPAREEALIWDGAEASRLIPGLDEALGVPVDDSPTRFAAAAEMIQFVADNPPTMAFPALLNNTPAGVACMHRVFDKHDTERLVRFCKSNGISVTTAVHAALVLAGRRCDLRARARLADELSAETKTGSVSEGRGGKRPYIYTDLTSFSLRRYLPEPYCGPNAAPTIYHTGLPVRVVMPWEDEGLAEDGKDSPISAQLFSHVTGQLSGFYKKDLGTDPPGLFDFLSHWVRTITSACTIPTDGGQEHQGPPPAPPALPDLSSLGVLENHLKHEYTGSHKLLTLHDWRIRVQIIDQHIMCNCWTWRGEFHVQAVWNTAFYIDGFVDELMNDWQAILSERVLD